ncbi:TolC family protein [Marinobacter sp. 2_MG-2023]|uniref:TolC family protein n=1 Tax=Marinobacter sp. 2_MG-2023 TaxID=3062679 RepID=UPI0026E17FE0|nr:TolC family protein [Marinobacter sp. 2_MG-2023]MDO6441279.1 TolC family protein [Marinobacter sp. 2_MG-2023]
MALFCLATAGCSSLSTSPDYLAQADSDRQNLVSWSELDAGSESAYLDDLVSSGDLNALIAEARAANPDLGQTLLSLEILRAQYRATQADQLPDVEAGFGANKTEDLDTSYTGSISVSWELDLWAKISDEASAAASDVAEQLALYQAARDTLAAEVMQGWLKLVNLNRSVAIEEQRVELLEKNEEWILQRYRSGLGDLEDLDSAQSSAASARASLFATLESLQQQQRALNLLLGRSHGSTAIAADYPQVLLPLADLADQTLQRRPDLKAAYLAIEANDFRTSVAYKEMLPSISLEAALSDTGTSPSEALLRNPVWSLLGQLTAPLFRGGELKANAEAAELTTARSYQAYRETLLNAVQEVENAISQESSLAKQQQQIDSALLSARRNYQQYQQKYRNGLVSVLDLLEVQEQTFDLESQLNDLIYERLSNRITLGLALGLGIKEADQS